MPTKTRIGILFFFLGLFMVFGALYLDQIRGAKTSVLGLYQIVATIIGYMILTIGLMVAFQTHGAHKSVRNILFIGGGVIAFVSILADYVGAATPPGFDRFQMVGLAVGAVLVGIGFFLPQGYFSGG
jgi:hypothetical protein